MTKTKQRKEQVYFEGRQDAFKELSKRYRKHRYQIYYSQGYRDGQSALKHMRENLPEIGFDDF